MSRASNITGGTLEQGIGEHEPISHRMPRHNSGGVSSRSWGWEVKVIKNREGWVVSLKMVG